MPTYYVKTFGASILIDRMDLSARQVNTLSTVFQRVLGDMRTITEEQITTMGARGGDRWPMLDADTFRKKGNWRLLYTTGSKSKYDRIDSDALVRSVTKRNAKYSIQRATKTGFEFGTRRPYAYVHQHGSARRNIPARPFLRVLPSDVTRWDSWVAQYLVLPFKDPLPEKAD